MTVRGLLLALLVAGGTAAADPKLDEAKQHLTTATQLYDENNFRGALVEFQRAYELAPSYKILFNIGQVSMELQDYAGALRAYSRYLAEGGPDVPADRVTQVTAEIDRLKGRVGKITVVTQAGSEVLVDDVQVGFAPLPEPLAVNAGQHKVTVHANGKDPVSRVYDVAGRQEVTAALGNQAAPAPAVTPPSGTEVKVAPKPAGPKSTTPVYVGWSVTGGLAITAGILAIVTHGAEDDLATLRGTYPVTNAQLASQRDTVKRDALLTDIFTGAAVVSAGISLYFTLTRTGQKAHEHPDAVRLEVGPGSVAVGGRF